MRQSSLQRGDSSWLRSWPTDRSESKKASRSGRRSDEGDTDRHGRSGKRVCRANLFATRDEQAKIYPDRQWLIIFIGGSYQFLSGSERLLDARNMFFYYATGITPAMSMAKVGSGSAYAAAFRDSKGNYFDSGTTYKITLPAPIPAKEFWSFAVYDNQTRSLLKTDHRPR